MIRWSQPRLNSRPTSQARTRFVTLRLEALEDRTVPYAASGNLWAHPELVTLSFQPDGTNLGGPASNLFAKFNAAYGSSAAWQNVILRAAQAWAQVTNVNFSVVADNGTASGGGAYQQGDPGMGDIRFGGFNFNNSSILALAYMPPAVNNYSVAGDIAFNTGKVFNINGLDYDLFTVAAHEIGHALGLSHTSINTARLYSAYTGVESALHADDIAGGRNVYSSDGARTADAFDAAAANGSFAAATNLTSQINPSTLTAALNRLDITSTTDVDFYKFTAPAGGNGQVTIKVQSSGLSLLAPSLKVYNASQAQIATATGSGYLGSTLTTTLNVTAGQTYYIRVAGANTTAFGTGAYGLTLSFAGNPVSVTPPVTQVANATPANGGGGVANRTDSNGVSIGAIFDLLGGIGGLLGGTLNNLLKGINFASVQTIGDGRFEPGAGLSPFGAADVSAFSQVDRALAGPGGMFAFPALQDLAMGGIGGFGTSSASGFTGRGETSFRGEQAAFGVSDRTGPAGGSRSEDKGRDLVFVHASATRVEDLFAEEEAGAWGQSVDEALEQLASEGPSFLDMVEHVRDA